VISPSQLALVKAKLEKAQAELTLAQTHLQFTFIRAPFDGIVGMLQVRIGSLLEEGELLTTLTDNTELWVYFNLPERDYLDYMRRVRPDSTTISCETYS
jgi:membrane fusion protein (multidrug efflux system)